MTQEEKQLLYKDLCARLPYGVIVDNPNPVGGIWDEVINIDTSMKTVTLLYGERVFSIDDVKPYLRPMESMTKEEKYIYRHMLGATLNSEGESIMFAYVEDFPAVIDWLNAHHFDFRGLIEEGLALEAPDDMYKFD
jgi:hypothetical protein